MWGTISHRVKLRGLRWPRSKTGSKYTSKQKKNLFTYIFAKRSSEQFKKAFWKKIVHIGELKIVDIIKCFEVLTLVLLLLKGYENLGYARL